MGNIHEVYVSQYWDHDHKIWFDSNDLQYTWSLHSSTVRKLQRQGVLKGRDLKNKDGIAYFTVFLVDENKVFIKNNLKKPKIKFSYKESINSQK